MMFPRKFEGKDRKCNDQKKNEKGQTMIYKTLRKLKIGQHEQH
jgi:hypothetical protein